jgi:hypothetical protein
MTKEQHLADINSMSSHFLFLEESSKNEETRRYYAGVAAGLNKAYKLILDEMPYNLIRDE